MEPEEVTFNYPRLKNLLNPVSSNIISLNVRPGMHGNKAVIRFRNDYGLELLKHINNDFFEMTVIKFRGGI